ncbi:MAG TPA: histidine kinase dimerization/phospho-acceptor domain-containing protein, partial [Steroidobacteraceae bacterium]|nr:histidine kinase dimerization/phospho-acceptor domain-containing protein [Steroidobacteraceae bacterium]
MLQSDASNSSPVGAAMAAARAQVQPVTSNSALDLSWRVVALANIYRLLLPPMLLTLQWATRQSPSVGMNNPQLFVLICAVYWLLGALVAFGGRGHWPSRRVLVVVNIVLDTAAICWLLYYSGGVSSGLGILLVIPVGAMSLLAEGRATLGVASMAALGLLTQQILAVTIGHAQTNDYLLAGILGAVLFLVSLLAWPVSSRLRESEALVRRQEIDLANLAQLSQYIVQHLRESILVVDPSDGIRLINESAAQVLGDTVALPGALLGEVAPRLLYLLETWRRDPGVPSVDAGTFVAADGARIIRPHFAPLGTSEPAPVIVFLEDTGEIAARVQQTKLAALGRLSASIAHEIRNPIGAMSHAAQLLAESPELNGEDRRLTEIVQVNSTRVSTIIDNILQLSRREAPKPETVMLAAWTQRFRDEFNATLQLQGKGLVIDLAAEDIHVRIDGSQLHQIVWNLCQNSVTHALPDASDSSIELRYGRLA